MFEIILINERGERFAKKYNSYFLYQKALNKYKHSKKIKIVSYGRN